MSAKVSDLARSKRPATAKQNPLNLRKDKTKLTRDFSILTRLKPRGINIDKERLYEENMALKLRNNCLSEELIKLKTRISHAEKELNRKDEQNDQFQTLKPTHLINRLKLSIKDLKVEIQQKNEDISKVKRHIKATKINEIEVEIQAYIDECTRLRHHLEEIMRQRDSPQRPSDDKTSQQGLLFNNLKSDNENLNQALTQCQEELNKWRDRVLELEKDKKSSSTKKKENSYLKTELQKAKIQLEQANKEIDSRDGNYKDEMQRLRLQLDSAQKEIASRDNFYKDEIQKLKQQLEQANKQVASKDYSYKDELQKTKSQLEQANKDLASRDNNYRDEMQKAKAQLDKANKEISSRDTNYTKEITDLKQGVNELKQQIAEYESKVKELQKLLEDQRIKIKNYEEAKFAAQKIKWKSPPKIFRIMNNIIESHSFALGSLINSLDKNHNHILSLEDLHSGLYMYNTNMKTKYILEILGMLKINKNREVSLNKLEQLHEEFSFNANDNISISDDEPEYQGMMKASVEADFNMKQQENNKKKGERDKGKKKQEEKVSQPVPSSKAEIDIRGTQEKIVQVREVKEIERKASEGKFSSEIKVKQEEEIKEEKKKGEKKNRNEEKIKIEEEIRKKEKLKVDEEARQEEMRIKAEKLREEERVKEEENQKLRIKEEEEEKLKQEAKLKEEKRLKLEENLRQEEILKNEEKVRQEERIKQEEKVKQEERSKQEERTKQEENYLREQERIKQEQKLQLEEKLKQEEKKRQEEKLKQEEQKKDEERIKEEKRLKKEKKAKDDEALKQKEAAKQESKPKQETPTSRIPEENKPEESTETKNRLNSRKSSKSKIEKSPSLKQESTVPQNITPILKIILDHFSFRMQINRIPKSKLLVTLFGNAPSDKLITKSDLTVCLKRSPFNFTPEEIDALSQFLLDTSQPSVKLLEEKLRKVTDDWEVFTPEDEEGFDVQLGIIVSKNKMILKESCQKFDKENIGLITLDQFKGLLQEVAVEFPPRVFKYILLLFYSHDMKLNQVPYRHFIEAYSESASAQEAGPEDEEEEGEDEEAAENSALEEEKAKVVRHYLSVMAKVLIQNKRSAPEVFECDENGLISAEEFVVGLRRLGMREVEHEHVMIMLEALQFEDTNEICVSLDELEEILVHYGVTPISENTRDVDAASEKSMGQHKNEGLMDSEEEEENSLDKEEYSDDEHYSEAPESGNDYEEDFQ